MRTPRLVIAALAAAALVAGLFLGRETVVDERAALRELMPEQAFSAVTDSPPRYRSPSGDIAFNSYSVTPAVRGYAGPIKVLVVLGPDGRIKGLKVLEHRETKNYVHYLETPDYLNRFIGKSVLDRFEVDRDVDGISRATVSVEALARTVRESSREVARREYGIQDEGIAPSRTGWEWAAYLVLFAGAAGGYTLTRRKPGHRRLRDASLAASFILIGIVLASPFSILHVFNLLLGRTSSSALWYVMMASTILSVLVAGRFYCGWLCPFGALSELLARLPLGKWTIDASDDDRWRNVKYVLLGGTAASVLFFRRPEYGNDEVYVTFFSLHGSALAWGLVAVMLLANLRVPRFWCRYFCPVAAFLGLLCRKTAGYPSAPSCPMGNKRDPKISECIRCNRCYRRFGAAL